MTTYTDGFNRPNTSYPTGLGSIPNGGPTWQYINGSWRINNNTAQTETPRSSNPIAAVELVPDVTLDLDISSNGGDALYFRIVNAANWWRLRKRRWTTSSTSTEYEWERHYNGLYGSSIDGQGDHSHSIGSASPTAKTWHTSSTSSPSFPSSAYHTHHVTNMGTISHQHPTGSGNHTFWNGNTRDGSTTTTTHRRLYLERSVDGSVTNVTSSSGTTSKIGVECNGNTIAVYKSGSTTPWNTITSSIHNTATLHGIGRGTSDLNGHSIDNFVATLSNQPPLAPTLHPIGTINVDSTNRLEWTFNDPDPFDSQSKFDLRARVQGTSTWTIEITQNTSNTRWDSPPGTFSVNTWEWEVRTYDALGYVGPWSTTESFIAAETPDTPNITKPINNGTVSVTPDTIEWSIPNQDKYQLRIVADDNGNPNTGNIRYDTGEVTSSSTRSVSVEFPDQIFEHAQVRVEYGGLWSTWASVRYEVSYIPPPSAIIEFQDYNSQGAVILHISNPESQGSEAQAISNIIRRRTINTNWAIIGDDINLNSQFIDYTVENEVEYEYSIVTLGQNETSVESISYFNTITYNQWFMKDFTAPDGVDVIELFVDGRSDLNIEVHEDMAEFTPLGRKYKQVVRDVIRGHEFNLTVQLLGIEQITEFKEMRERQKVLLLQGPIGQWYFTFGKDVSRKILNTLDNYELVTFRVIEQPDPFNV